MLPSNIQLNYQKFMHNQCSYNQNKDKLQEQFDIAYYEKINNTKHEKNLSCLEKNKLAYISKLKEDKVSDLDHNKKALIEIKETHQFIQRAFEDFLANKDHLENENNEMKKAENQGNNSTTARLFNLQFMQQKPNTETEAVDDNSIKEITKRTIEGIRKKTIVISTEQYLKIKDTNIIDHHFGLNMTVNDFDPKLSLIVNPYLKHTKKTQGDKTSEKQDDQNDTLDSVDCMIKQLNALIHLAENTISTQEKTIKMLEKEESEIRDVSEEIADKNFKKAISDEKFFSELINHENIYNMRNLFKSLKNTYRIFSDIA